jgi:cytochrome c oxidase subunit II
MPSPKNRFWIGFAMSLGILGTAVLIAVVFWGNGFWKKVTTDAEPSGQIVKIEVTARRWKWILRYPGADNTFGAVDFHLITPDNVLGIDSREGNSASHDDFLSDTLFLPKNATIDLQIRSQDVLHTLYMPHFRVKMDAVPGMETRFRFVPTETTAERRAALKAESAGKPNGQERLAEVFDFELLCANICGAGHYAMRRVVVVLSQDAYAKWLAKASRRPMLGAASPQEGLGSESLLINGNKSDFAQVRAKTFLCVESPAQSSAESFQNQFFGRGDALFFAAKMEYSQL